MKYLISNIDSITNIIKSGKKLFISLCFRCHYKSSTCAWPLLSTDSLNGTPALYWLIEWNPCSPLTHWMGRLLSTDSLNGTPALHWLIEWNPCSPLTHWMEPLLSTDSLNGTPALYWLNADSPPCTYQTRRWRSKAVNKRRHQCLQSFI